MSASQPYSEYERVLRTAHSVTDAAEAHGILVGALCALDDYDCDDWLSEILPEGPVATATRIALEKLFAGTREALAATDLRFELLCLDDDESIENRTQTLSLWCNGFIYGLGVNGNGDPRQLPGDVGEIISDLTEIARAGVEPEDGEEANEAAFAELVEFVRVGVQLVHDELAEQRQPPPPRVPGSVSVH